ncbi:MAG: hypothetical protein AAB467_03500 [Patescibacteria group bacterium]
MKFFEKLFKLQYFLILIFIFVILFPTGQASATGACYCVKDGNASCQSLAQLDCNNFSNASKPYGSCSWANLDGNCDGLVDEFNRQKSPSPFYPPEAPEGANNPLPELKLKAQSTLSQLPTTDAAEIIGIAVKGLVGFMGSIMFVMVLYGGIMMMTAQGNTERVEKSKKIMIWAALGATAMLISYIVVNFVFSSISSGT